MFCVCECGAKLDAPVPPTSCSSCGRAHSFVALQEQPGVPRAPRRVYHAIIRRSSAPPAAELPEVLLRLLARLIVEDHQSQAPRSERTNQDGGR